MIRHYLKVAFRNLWKYRNQTLVSIIGLAVGFVCFAMSALWIRYEMTYDSFHRNAGQMYCIYRPAVSSDGIGMWRNNPCPLAKDLKNAFPEIKHAVAILPPYKDSAIEFDGVESPAAVLGIDSSFFEMFDVSLVEGSMDFTVPGQKQIAVTREKALQMFGNETPVGKRIRYYDSEYTVCAVVTGFPKHSNYPFDFLHPGGTDSRRYLNHHIIVELVPGIDVEAFGKKLYNYAGEKDAALNLTAVPLTSIHCKDPGIPRNVKFQHIIIFSVAGLLLVFCTLFNYLTLFISRFRIRQREFALRTVCGASAASLFMLLSVEFLVSVIIALLSGLFLADILSSPFVELSGVRLEMSAIYFELLIYIAAIILISLLTFLVTLAVFRRKALNAAIRSRNRKMFRKTSIAVQLTVSIAFTFCTVVILKQMYYLHNTDLGFEFKNRGSVTVQTMSGDNIDVLENKIRQIPGITETFKGHPLLPVRMYLPYPINTWDGKSGDGGEVSLRLSDIPERFCEFYGIKLIEGEALTDKDGAGYVLINESARKAFGWNRAVGKSFVTYDNVTYTVKGVIQNIYSSAPTLDAQPAFYNNAAWRGFANMIGNMSVPSIIFKFSGDTWKPYKVKIEAIVKELYPDTDSIISSTEEEYDKFLKSENALLAILTVISIICVLVCVFGFVSAVSLTCEERRKEIAIRKISGATVKDILDIFFKEYLTLLATGALIAFPAGYIAMKRWLENYILQTDISAWIYASILFALIMAIVVCVGGKVYRTSRENPVNAIKS
jgi:ABC-type antimicrobial peptide transport system permease subunit